jgi:hypothetical protein
VTAPEDLLLLASAATAERRSALAGALRGEVDWRELLRIAERQRMVPLVRARLPELLPASPPSEFAEPAARIHDAAAQLARHNELATLRIVAELDGAGIRALPIKGALLARDLYGDAALRQSADVDVLVPREQLGRAAEVLAAIGYAAAAGDEELHARMVHSAGLPDVELHWRIHWYGDGFSAAMLAGAEPRGDGSLRAQPEHEYASLLLYWARDGFAGLRLAADVAQWWDRFGDRLPGGAVAALAASHPELARPLTAAAQHAERLIGVPYAGARSSPPAAVRLGDWRLGSGDDQIRANVALTDVLLAPPGARRGALRRRLRRRGAGPLHAVRVAGRWAVALWRVRGGRDWAPLPPQWTPRALRENAGGGGRRPSVRA